LRAAAADKYSCLSTAATSAPISRGKYCAFYGRAHRLLGHIAQQFGIYAPKLY
jgi:hypothetical protein